MQAFSTEKSRLLYEKTKRCLVDGVASSFHKAPDEEYPVCVTHGSGSKLYDVDGNEYIDYVAGFGPVILGHANGAVARAVSEQLARGTQFSATTPQICALAERLCGIIPCAGRVMFQNTGTEAVMTAFRVARAFTGKSKIVKFEGQYHGWSDEEKVTIDAAGVDELGPIDNINKIINTKGQRRAAADDIIVAPWNDAEALRAILRREQGSVACVVMEPFMLDSGPIRPREGYLAAAKALCEEYGALLCFDEVITGFRLSLGGAQQYFGVVPHMATFAKAMAAGCTPVAIVAGRADIMEAGVKVSGTFNGNPVGVAAAAAAIEQLARPGLYADMERLGGMLCSHLRALGKKHGIPLFCAAHGSVVMLQLGTAKECETFRDFLRDCDIPRYQRLFVTAGKYGVRLTSKRGRLYLTAAHTEEDINRTADILDVVFGLI